MRKRGGTWMQRWRVPLGFLSAVLFFWLARPDARSLIAGGLIALVGVSIRAWASGHIRKNDVLAISGPYAYTRNPLYLGSFVLGFGFSVASGNLWLWLLFAALFLGIYWPVMRVEAETLAGLFGTDYANYARAVPLFLPRLTPYRGETAEKIKFDPQLYVRYREYRATVGLLLAWGVLALKAFLAR